MAPHFNNDYYPATGASSTISLDIILLLLAGVAGSIDVTSYFGLGHVFTANMTGNTIVLGLSIARANYPLRYIR